jgi:integrase
LAPIVVFAVETGMRRGEIQSLRWSSIDLGRRIARVESHNSKTLRSRLIPISARCAEVLSELWRNSNRRQDALVFHGIDFKKSFNATREKAGLTDVKFHDLRHTAITRMLEAGISAPLVMKISGHTQQKTFLRYVNQTENSIFEIAMQLDKAA